MSCEERNELAEALERRKAEHGRAGTYCRTPENQQFVSCPACLGESEPVTMEAIRRVVREEIHRAEEHWGCDDDMRTLRSDLATVTAERDRLVTQAIDVMRETAIMTARDIRVRDDLAAQVRTLTAERDAWARLVTCDAGDCGSCAVCKLRTGSQPSTPPDKAEPETCKAWNGQWTLQGHHQVPEACQAPRPCPHPGHEPKESAK